MTRAGLLVFGATLLAACTGGDEGFQIQVLDAWGEPLEGATVKIDGQPDRPTTDAEGRATLPLVEGTLRVTAGCCVQPDDTDAEARSYIRETREIEILGGEAPHAPVFRLYPAPPDKGFYLVGASSYAKLEPQSITAIADQNRTLYGLREGSGVDTPKGEVRIVYRAPLKKEQVRRLQPRLHTLKWLDKASIVGDVEATEVSVDMYVSDGSKPIEPTELVTGEDYLFVLEDLQPGTYALATRGLLGDITDQDFERMPEALRTAFPFVVVD